jgi:hypothetical protein
MIAAEGLGGGGRSGRGCGASQGEGGEDAREDLLHDDLLQARSSPAPGWVWRDEDEDFLGEPD